MHADRVTFRVALPAIARGLLLIAVTLPLTPRSMHGQVQRMAVVPPAQAITFTAAVPAAPAQAQVYKLAATAVPTAFINEKLTAVKLPVLRMEEKTLVSRGKTG